jgi:SAM-dependent methyltransferase/predicted esterase
MAYKGLKPRVPAAHRLSGIFLLLLSPALLAGGVQDSRDRLHQPDRVMDSVGVKPGMRIGEVGAGSGYFTFHLARRVGESGKVYANDISRRALNSLERRREREGIVCIETVLGEEDDPLLPQGLDMVFIVNAFHDIAHQVTLLNNLAPSLKPGAAVVIIDRDPQKIGSFSDHVLTQEGVLAKIETSVFELDRIETFLPQHNIYIIRVPGDPDSEALSSYAQMRARLGELYRKQDYAEAADLLDSALNRFPEHLKANTFNLGLMCSHLQQYDRGVKALLFGLEHGIWYGLYDFTHTLWDPYRERADFLDFMNRNDQKRQEAQDRARPELRVVTPKGFSEKKEYPLFIALHGGGENMETFSRNWRSARLEDEFLVAYLQSSQVVSMDGFGWTEDLPLAKEEILAAYRRILQEYRVDGERILIGGFSSGGVAALMVTLDEVLPVAGFVVLCPARPEGFTAEKVREAARRGIRGVLLTTEMDRRLEDQRAMAALMAQEALPCDFLVTPDIGHWYPEDLEAKIDQGIAYVLSK